MFTCVVYATCEGKKGKALPGGTLPQSYGTSLAIWDHTVLPATRHKWTHPTSPQPCRLVLWYSEGWKA